MDETAKTAAKVRGVSLATVGLTMALLLMLGMKAAGLTGMSYAQWGVALVSTAAVQAGFLLVAWRRWDDALYRAKRQGRNGICLAAPDAAADRPA